MPDPAPFRLDIADMRESYTRDGLHEGQLKPDPFEQFEEWFQIAKQSGLREPNAVTVATATQDGVPSARVVLLKSFDPQGFVFFTSHDSQKAQELNGNPHASMLFAWIELERQVRIDGTSQRVPQEQAEAYWRRRPRGSQLGAWASEQSAIIPGREVLEHKLEELTQRFQGQDVPLPPFWGGYRVAPYSIEFWQGRQNRLHDRLRYRLTAEGAWQIERLSP